MANKTIRFVIEMDESLRDRFKERAEKDGRTMKYIVTQYVKQYTFDRKEIK